MADYAYYVNEEGKQVPRVTQILNILNKPALIKWANFLGFKRQSYDAVLLEKSNFGSRIHLIIYSILSGQAVIYAEKGKLNYGDIYTTIDNFIEWGRTNKLEPILLEEPLIGDEYGGTCDYYGKLNGLYTIIDFKTSKQPRETMFIQLGAYCQYLEKKGMQVDQVCVLIVNPKECQKYIIPRKDLDKYIETFNGLLKVYNLVQTLTIPNKRSV